MSALWYYRPDKVFSSRPGALVLWNYGQPNSAFTRVWLQNITDTSDDWSLSIVDRKTLKETGQPISFNERITYEDTLGYGE